MCAGQNSSARIPEIMEKAPIHNLSSKEQRQTNSNVLGNAPQCRNNSGKQGSNASSWK